MNPENGSSTHARIILTAMARITLRQAAAQTATIFSNSCTTMGGKPRAFVDTHFVVIGVRSTLGLRSEAQGSSAPSAFPGSQW
jgi:hypothetical protein